MSVLIVAEHDNATLNLNTLNTVSAAARLGGELHLLVAGQDADAVIESARSITGVARVLSASHEGLP